MALRWSPKFKDLTNPALKMAGLFTHYPHATAQRAATMKLKYEVVTLPPKYEPFEYAIFVAE
jgi:hypothetical protein